MSLYKELVRLRLYKVGWWNIKCINIKCVIFILCSLKRTKCQIMDTLQVSQDGPKPEICLHSRINDGFSFLVVLKSGQFGRILGMRRFHINQ